MALAAGRAAARSLSRVAERSHAPADDGCDGRPAVRAVRCALAERRGARGGDATTTILSEWAGLGYYARARNLIACAREVVRRGGFPTTAAELRKLPGVGAYTSAAIAAIAFGEPAAAVDTNVARVIARLNASRASQPRRDRAAGARDDAWRPAWRFRPGDDGSRRDHLPAAKSRAAANARWRPIAGVRQRRSGAIPGAQAARRPPASLWRRLVDRTRRLGVAGPPAGDRACSAEWPRCRAASGASSRRAHRRDRHRPPCLHPFLARPCASFLAPSRKAKAGGSRSTGSTKPVCRHSTAAPPTWSLAARVRGLKRRRTHP